MRYTPPTPHVLYFGIQAKNGNLDSSGATRAPQRKYRRDPQPGPLDAGPEIFDLEIGKRGSRRSRVHRRRGAQIIKARNLARHHPAQPVMFVVRNDILNLYVVTKLPVPAVEPPF